MRFIMSFAALLFMVMPAQGSNDISKNNLRVEGDFCEYRNRYEMYRIGSEMRMSGLNRFCTLRPSNESSLLKEIHILGHKDESIRFTVLFVKIFNPQCLGEFYMKIGPLRGRPAVDFECVVSKNFHIRDQKEIKEFFQPYIDHSLMRSEFLDQILMIIQQPIKQCDATLATKLQEAEDERRALEDSALREKERDRRQQEDERRLAQPKLVRDISDIWDAAVAGIKATL